MGRHDRFSLHSLIGSLRRAGVLLAGALALFVAPFPSTLTATALAQGSIEPGGPASDSAPAARAGRPNTAKPARKKPVRKSRGANSGDVAAVAQPAAPEWTATNGVDALANELGAMLNSRTRNGEWGAIVVSLSRGDTLFKSNADAMMQPASTMKLYTAAMALERFGPNHEYKTTIFRDAQPSADGVLSGSLYLFGDGDPSLCPRFWGDANPMDSLAHQIAASGIKRIRGDIVGDASAFDDQLVPDGWKSRYLGAAYAARVSALSLNENIVWVVVQPNGRTAAVSLDPPTTTIPVQSSVRVVNGRYGRISASRRLDGGISVRGTIGERSGPLRYSLVVEDPATFTTGALRAALEKAGVTVDGKVTLGVTPPHATQVATVSSPPLAEIVAEMNRESINLYAELLFRGAARSSSTGQVGSAQAGLSTLRSFLADKVGVRPIEVSAADGSGLSVLDRVTPRSMVQLLGYAHAAPWGPTFHASLPLEGESGTLRNRARHTPARGNLHAKTGTTNTVASLGGYVTAKNGEVLAFAFIYNGGDRWNAKMTMDQMGATMAEWVRD